MELRKEKKKNACEKCRRSKLRCHLDTFDECGKCCRCFTSDIECVFVTLPPRKPRRRTDARVTTLEKELVTMRKMFIQLQDDRDPASRQDSPKSSRSAGSSGASPELTLPSTSGADSPFTSSSNAVEVIPCLLSSSMLTETEARDLFNEFVTHSLPQYPLIILDEPFDIVRESKPMLLLAAITAASNARDGELFARLHGHLIRMVSDRVVVNGERSLELLQSIILLEVWFSPSDDLRKLNFYQWIHVAATMAMQLGLVGETASSTDFDPSNSSSPDVDDDSLRLGLAVYFSCSS